MTTEDLNTADPVDVHVGARIRQRRLTLGISQSGLGEALGVSFQQVQKYERGSNRVSASMMVRAAAKLDVSPAWFFEGLPSADAPPESEDDARTRVFAQRHPALMRALAGMSPDAISVLVPLVQHLRDTHQTRAPRRAA